MLAAINLLIANLKMNFRNKQAIAWTFVMPIILMVLFGLAFGKEQKLTFKVGIVDEAGNGFSKDFAKGLEKVDSFQVTKNGRDAELKSLKDGERSAVIILPKGFGASAQKLIDAKKRAAVLGAQARTAANTSAAGQGAVQARQPAQAQGNTAPSGQPGLISPSPALPKVEASNLEVYYDNTNLTTSGTAKMVMSQVVSGMNQKISGSPQLFKIQEKQVTARKLSNIDFFAAGILAMFTMNGGVMSVIMIIVGYRERGILRRLQATPLSISTFLGTQILVRVLIALLQMALLLGIAIWGFGAHVSGSPWLLTAIVVEGSLVFIALGFAVASFTKTTQASMAVGNVITMPMMFLSGVFFPTESFPKFVQPIIKVLPLTYLAKALREVMMRGSGFSAVAWDMGVLALFGLVIFLLSVFMFRWE